MLKRWHPKAGLRGQTPAHGPPWLQALFPWTESTGNTAFHPKPETNGIVKQQRPLKQKKICHHPHSAVSCARSFRPPRNAAFTPEKLNLERVCLFHLVGYFSESLIHWRMYLHLVAWALQGTSELCLPVGNVTACWGRNGADCGNHRETTNRGS